MISHGPDFRCSMLRSVYCIWDHMSSRRTPLFCQIWSPQKSCARPLTWSPNSVERPCAFETFQRNRCWSDTFSTGKLSQVSLSFLDLDICLGYFERSAEVAWPLQTWCGCVQLLSWLALPVWPCGTLGKMLERLPSLKREFHPFHPLSHWKVSFSVCKQQ